MDKSTNGYTKCANAIVEWVWLENSTALLEGEAVCYNTNYGTATARDGRRCNRVELPTSSNNKAFAGVAARNYPAHSGGQFIEIYCPGSKGVNVALGVSTVIDTGKLTFTVGQSSGLGTEAGRFVKQGFGGRGTIVPRQTVTALVEASMIGAWSLSANGLTLTMSDTTGLSVGDTVVILGGPDQGATNKHVKAGKYTIATVPGGTTVTLTVAAVHAAITGAAGVTGYAYTGNPVCQADLEDGDESGGVEFISPADAGTDALGYMIGGWTYICGGLTLAADAEFEFADGTIFGEKKGFWCLGAMTTSAVVVDLVTAGYLITGADCDEVQAINAAGDAVTLEWALGAWKVTGFVGCTPTHA